MKKKISFIKQQCLRAIQIQHEVNLIKLLPKAIDPGDGSHEKSDKGRLITGTGVKFVPEPVFSLDSDNLTIDRPFVP